MKYKCNGTVEECLECKLPDCLRPEQYILDGERYFGRRRNGAPVLALQIDDNEKVLSSTRYANRQEASKKTGVSEPMISECLRGKRRSYKGYTFRMPRDMVIDTDEPVESIQDAMARYRAARKPHKKKARCTQENCLQCKLKTCVLDADGIHERINAVKTGRIGHDTTRT